MTGIGSLIVFYYTFIRGPKIKVVRQKILKRDSDGIYKISFSNKGHEEGLINVLNPKVNGKECLVYDENGKSISCPIQLSAGKHFTFILDIGRACEGQSRNFFCRVVYLMTKKKFHKATLSYATTSNNKIKNRRYHFYLLEDS